MFDTTEHLIEEIGHPLVVQIHLDHLAKIGIHQLHDQITGTTIHITYQGSDREDWPKLDKMIKDGSTTQMDGRMTKIVS